MASINSKVDRTPTCFERTVHTTRSNLLVYGHSCITQWLLTFYKISKFLSIKVILLLIAIVCPFSISFSSWACVTGQFFSDPNDTTPKSHPWDKEKCYCLWLSRSRSKGSMSAKLIFCSILNKNYLEGCMLDSNNSFSEGRYLISIP